MDISNQHNLRRPQAGPEAQHFGIRVTMPAGDPLRRVLGEDWHREHWYATRDERDAAILDMGQRHAYSRIGDTPSIRLEPIER